MIALATASNGATGGKREPDSHHNPMLPRSATGSHCGHHGATQWDGIVQRSMFKLTLGSNCQWSNHSQVRLELVSNRHGDRLKYII